MVNKPSGDGQAKRRPPDFKCWLMLYSLSLLITFVWSAGASEFRVANLRQLRVEAVGGQVHYEKPNWSTDGTALTFETRRGKERRLWVQLLDSGVTHELLSKKSTTVKLGGAVPGVAAVANYDATWSIGGDKITYVGSGQHGYFGLFYVAFGGWVNPVRFVAGGDGDPYVAFPDYHPKADLVVFSMGEETSRRGEGRLDLHAAESLPPVQGRNIPSSRVLQAGAMEGVPQLQPEFSPDGGMIAFVGIRRGNNDIYTLPVLYHPRAGLKQRGEPTRLTSWSAPEVQPSWSPDGQQLAYVANRGVGNDIYLIAISGGDPIALTNDGSNDRFPSWSPDGTRIAFESNRNGDFEIWTMAADGTDAVNLSDDLSNDRYPAWSRDGSRIAFSSDRAGSFDIYSMNADGSGLLRHTTHAAADRSPSWSPDDSWICFETTRDGEEEVWALPVDTSSEPVNLTASADVDWDPDWSPVP